MESARPKLPTEAIELYNKFIHGGMSRRAPDPSCHQQAVTSASS
jgi:hypothetical protein